MINLFSKTTMSSILENLVIPIFRLFIVFIVYLCSSLSLTINENCILLIIFKHNMSILASKRLGINFKMVQNQFREEC